jgi:hypothetical protein
MVVSDAMNDAGYRSQILVAHSTGEAGVAHDVNETGVVVLFRVREMGNAAVDPCKGKCVTRASVTPEGRRSNVKVFV